MRSFSFLIALLFAFTATSYAFPELHLLDTRKNHGNGTRNRNGTANGNSVNRACKQMAKLTKITELANNQTKLDAMVAKGKLNDTDVAEIKTKAADATTQLQAMQSNTTLVAECAVVSAHQEVRSQCRQMAKLEKLASMADNQTAIDALVAKKQLNDTEKALVQERIANATTKLQEMSTNTTLTGICSSEFQQKSNEGPDDTSTGTSSSGTATPEQSTGGAMSLTVQSMPYVFLPALATFFALFL